MISLYRKTQIPSNPHRRPNPSHSSSTLHSLHASSNPNTWTPPDTADVIAHCQYPINRKVLVFGLIELNSLPAGLRL